MRIFNSVFLAFTGLLASSYVYAQGAHSLDAVRAAAVSAVQSQLPVSRGQYFLSAGALDSRLRLDRCAMPLEAAPQPTAGNASASGRMTVGVRCATGNTWTVYVPVKIEVEMPVLVLLRNVARDAHISPDDVQLQTKRVSGSASNFATSAADLQGRHLKRALTAGSPLTLDALVVDVLVRRGQQVTLLARTQSVEIRAQGYALADAGLNDRLRVQNVNSLKVVEGFVESAGTVRIEL